MMSRYRVVIQNAVHSSITRPKPPRDKRCNFSSFTWTGPRELNDILKKELLIGKSREEISDIWLKYHREKDQVHGTTLTGQEGLKILQRAKESPFFIQPVFRDDGYFILVSQFQPEHHFLMTYLEDYKIDPARAPPLLTCSVFVDYAHDPDFDLTMVRSDVIARTIDDGEAMLLVTNIMDSYRNDDEYKQYLHTFNHAPEKFNFDDFISYEKLRWKNVSCSQASD